MNAEAILQGIREVLAAPAENMQLTLLLLGAAAALVLLLIVLVLLGVSLVRRPAAPARPVRIRRVRKADGTIVVQRIVPKVVAAPVAPRRQLSEEQVARLRRRQKALPWIAGAFVFAMGAAGYTMTSSGTYCATSCHSGSTVVKAAAKDAHATVTCVSCHEDALPLGAVANIATRGSRFVTHAGGSSGTTVTAEADVPARRCLDCHSGITSGVTVDRELQVRMSHSEPLAAGMRCTDCHGSVGHDAKRTPVKMSDCVTCHDGRKAPAKCATCHLGDTSAAGRVKERDFTNKVRLKRPTDCGSCHQQKKCDSCHGLRLPHTDEFIRYGHARQAAFDGKKTCYRCHTAAECQRCHMPFATSGHPTGWTEAHQASPKTASCSCHQAKMPPEMRQQPFCDACHSPQAKAIRQ